MDNATYESIKREAKTYFSDAKTSHDWDHTKRVYNLCMHIGKKEGADLSIVGIAAYLHDIARSEQDKSNGRLCHAEEGAKVAREILKKHDLDYEDSENIVHCIETHRYRDSKIPQTIEAKVLFDADKLDSIGTVGIGRAFMFAAEIGAKLHNPYLDVSKTASYTKDDTAYREYLVKLQHIEKRIITSEGKKIAEERHRFMVEFFDRLNQEVKGEL